MVPGELETKTGGYAYDRAIIDGLIERGWTLDITELRGAYPRPDERARRVADDVLRTLADGALTVVDGLAFGALDDVVARHAERLRLVALVHHPLALETGAEDAPALAERERRALRYARAVIATSEATARSLADDYGVERATVVEPGTEAREAMRAREGPPRLLSVGSLVSRKGHDVLLAALAELRELPWSLAIVGAARDRPYLDRLVEQRSRLGLEGRVELRGELGDEGLKRAYRAADVFVLASHHEGYGMVLTEATAYGLPVVTTTAGAIPETVPHATFVPPGQAAALADALRPLVTSVDARRAAAEASRTAASALPDWPTQVARFARALKEIR